MSSPLFSVFPLLFATDGNVSPSLLISVADSIRQALTHLRPTHADVATNIHTLGGLAGLTAKKSRLPLFFHPFHEIHYFVKCLVGRWSDLCPETGSGGWLGAADAAVAVARAAAAGFLQLI